MLWQNKLVYYTCKYFQPSLFFCEKARAQTIILGHHQELLSCSQILRQAEIHFKTIIDLICLNENDKVNSFAIYLFDARKVIVVHKINANVTIYLGSGQS
jgi:hypothetical protein